LRRRRERLWRRSDGGRSRIRFALRLLDDDVSNIVAFIIGLIPGAAAAVIGKAAIIITVATVGQPIGVGADDRTGHQTCPESVARVAIIVPAPIVVPVIAGEAVVRPVGAVGTTNTANTANTADATNTANSTDTTDAARAAGTADAANATGATGASDGKCAPALASANPAGATATWAARTANTAGG
jgi:hypothetical protein